MASSAMDASLPWPGYLIYRDHPADQQPDPTIPPLFFPPKDSDELFDALRLRFPSVKTHSERMRDAIIGFLIDERQAEQLLQTTTAQVADNSPFATLSIDHGQHSWPSVSSHPSSTWSSPEMLDLATPSCEASPLDKPTSMPSSTGATPAALEQMTGVFSLSSTTQPKQRNRRKMTDVEKLEYRARRIVKACDKCAKRKRKCQHNQPEVEHLTTKSSNKARSCTLLRDTVPSRAPAQAPQLPLDFDFDMFGIDEPFVLDDISFQPIDDLFEDHFGFNQSKQTRQSPAMASSHVDLATGREAWQERQRTNGHDMQPRIQSSTASRDWQIISAPTQHTTDNATFAYQGMTFDPAELAAGNWSGKSMRQLHDSEMVTGFESGGSSPRYPNASTNVDIMTRRSSRDSQSSSLRSASIGNASLSLASHNCEIHPPAQEAATSVTQITLSKQTSSAESIDWADSPATELYMLKRRVRAGLSTRTPITRPQRQLQTEYSNAHTAMQSRSNGGAYPRLETEIIMRSFVNVSTTAANLPATNASFAATLVHQDIPSYHMLCKDHHGRSSPHVERLSDHWTYRDHHGRSAHASPASDMAVMVGTVFGIAMLTVRVGLSVSMLFVALALCVQCTTKNSSWLATSTRLLSRSRLGAKKGNSWWSAAVHGVAWSSSQIVC